MSFYDTKRYKAVKLPNLLLLHWILNPGLAINEFVLGRRIPRLSLIDQHLQQPLTERSYVPCPHCQTLHPAKRWGKKNAFFHYAGLYCPSCQQKIPSLLNIFTIALLIVSFPLWKPVQMLFGERFKAWELKRLEKTAHYENCPPVKPDGVRMGLFYGGGMAVFFIVQNSLLTGFGREAILTGLGTGVIAGALFGAVMHFYLSRRGRQHAGKTHKIE